MTALVVLVAFAVIDAGAGDSVPVKPPAPVAITARRHDAERALTLVTVENRTTKTISDVDLSADAAGCRPTVGRMGVRYAWQQPTYHVLHPPILPGATGEMAISDDSMAYITKECRGRPPAFIATHVDFTDGSWWTLNERTAGANVPAGFADARERRKFERWLGADVVRALLGATRVEAYAIRPWPVGHAPAKYASDPPPSLPAGAPTQITGFPVYAVGREQGEDFARRLVAALFDPTTYTPELPPFGHEVIKGCAFAPGVAYRVFASDAEVDVVVCLHCDQVSVVTRAPRSKRLREAFGDVDGAHGRLTALAKEALGGVPEIAAISNLSPR
jgi:hypothetical protein